MGVRGIIGDFSLISPALKGLKVIGEDFPLFTPTLKGVRGIGEDFPLISPALKRCTEPCLSGCERHLLRFLDFSFIEKIVMKKSIFLCLMVCFLGIVSCSQKAITVQTKLQTNQDKNYWYSGEAEISSYKLTQARYGELREGEAVMVFVTEPFSKSSNAKADNPTSKDVPVLKLNYTKNFVTGIYPYSMMTSSFYPLNEENHSLKLSCSSQEWCGHTYIELQNKGKFEVEVNSYFEGASGNIKFKSDFMEDDLWTMIRVSQNQLPEGERMMVPSFFYLSLMHKPIKAYACTASLIKGDSTNTYTILYPDLDRTKSITFENTFPSKILSWEETYMDGSGNKKQKLTTKGERIKTLKSAYWGKNSNSDFGLRNELGLK